MVPGTNGPVGRAPILTDQVRKARFPGAVGRTLFPLYLQRRLPGGSYGSTACRLSEFRAGNGGSESRGGRRIRGVEPQGCFASPLDTPLVPGWPKGKLRVIYKQSGLPIYHKSLDWDVFYAEYPVPDVFERTVYRWPREKLRAF
jgi:hypothetical protein